MYLISDDVVQKVRDQGLRQGGRPRKPCRGCGSLERDSTGQCRPCKNRRRREARDADPAYRDKANVYQRAHQARQRAAGVQRKIKRRPTARLEYKTARRELERRAAGFHNAQQLAVILHAQGGHCVYCRRSKLERDHIIPLVRRGSNWPWNIQLLCSFHNASKGTLTDEEYRVRNGLPARSKLEHPYHALLLSIIG